MLTGWARCMGPILEIPGFQGYPPLPPRSIEIKNLAGKGRVIFGTQSLTGKTFRDKDLRRLQAPIHTVILLGSDFCVKDCGHKASGFSASGFPAFGFRLSARRLQISCSDANITGTNTRLLFQAYLKLLHSWTQQLLSDYASETYPDSFSTCLDYVQCSGCASSLACCRRARRDATADAFAGRDRRYPRAESAFVPAIPGMVREDRAARVEAR